MVVDHSVGAGLARTGVSDKAGSDKDGTTQAEIYVRVDLGDSLQITPSVQWIQNSGLDNTEGLFDKEITVYSVRASYTF